MICDVKIQTNSDSYDSTQHIAMISDVNTNNINSNTQYCQEFKLELNSHANMPVVGKGAHVEYTGRTADVNAFSPSYDTSQLPIVMLSYNMIVPIVDNRIHYIFVMLCMYQR